MTIKHNVIWQVGLAALAADVMIAILKKFNLAIPGLTA